MTIDVLCPSSREEWLTQRLLGASDIPALIMPDYPWQTPYGLWAQHCGLTPPRKDTHDMRLGRYIESVALKFLADEKPDWIVRPNVIGEGGTLSVDRENGLSCTQDAFVYPPERNYGVCNVKKVSAHAFREKWLNGGEAQVPAYVAIQVIQEMMLTRAEWGCVAAIVLGDFSSEFHLIEVPLHAGIVQRIYIAAREFWQRVRENDPYPADYHRDGNVISAVYRDDDGGEIDLSGNPEVVELVERHGTFIELEKIGGEAAKKRKAVDAQLKHLLGNAARGIVGDGRIIEARTVRRTGFTVEPSSYRSVKIKTLKASG